MDGRSDSVTAEFRREKQTLSQMEKMRDAIKRKYMLLKADKQTMEKALDETFKPIVKPLERLVNARHTLPKKEEVSRGDDEMESSFKTAYDAEEEWPKMTPDECVQQQQKTSPDEYVQQQSPDEYYDMPEVPALDKYLHMLNTNRKKYLDVTYGVRKLPDGSMMIGDSPIRFVNDDVIVGDRKYRSSVGLLELLFRKEPSAHLVSAEDKNVYGKILQTTNAHKKHYRSDEVIHRQRNSKYRDWVAPLVGGGTSTGSGILPRYKVARRNTRMDYVYWDDPNELVDRLRLLMAERSAGNSSHINEIISIIEELREAGIVI